MQILSGGRVEYQFIYIVPEAGGVSVPSVEDCINEDVQWQRFLSVGPSAICHSYAEVSTAKLAQVPVWKNEGHKDVRVGPESKYDQFVGTFGFRNLVSCLSATLGQPKCGNVVIVEQVPGNIWISHKCSNYCSANALYNTQVAGGYSLRYDNNILMTDLEKDHLDGTVSFEITGLDNTVGKYDVNFAFGAVVFIITSAGGVVGRLMLLPTGHCKKEISWTMECDDALSIICE